MGWSGGTAIFDKVASLLFKTDMFTAQQTHDILYVLSEALKQEDWDCESDSYYWNYPVVRDIFGVEPECCPECGGSGRYTGTGMMEDPNDPTGEPLPYPIEVLCGTCGGNGFM